MHDESEDLRRVGRDEMNLCEFPITTLADRVPPGCKTMTFEDRHGRLTVVGSDDYGLPTSPDSDVIVGLIQLTKLRNDFTDSTVAFTRYELLKLLGWPDQTRYYRRLRESLRRWVGVTLRYDGCWWDNRRKRRIDASFHILDDVVLVGDDDDGDGQISSSFTWGKRFFKSCRDGNLKRLDLDTYFALHSAVSKQLYRFLDKRFYLRDEWTFDLPELAFEHVGLSRNYAVRNIKQKQQPALEELERIGFLEPMATADRYSKVGRGEWKIRLVRTRPTPVETKPTPEPAPTGLGRELVARGVTPAHAVALVREFAEERVRRQLAVVDWLRETKPQQIKDVGAYLADAIRKDHAPPTGFASAAQRAASEAAAREQAERARQTRARARADRARVQAYWEGLSPEERARLEAEALAQAAPDVRASCASGPLPVRRLTLAAVRDAYIRALLDLPVSG